MCGRFTYLMTWKEIHDLYAGLGMPVDAVGEGIVEHPPRYNIAPTQPIVVVFENRDRREARLMRWGLVPTWVKDPRDFSLVINARVETILEKPSFRGGLQHHRCLIPASGYYEWLTGPDGKKQPFYITPRDGGPLMLGGVYSTWLGATGEEIDTTAIITVPAGGDTRFVHERMPAMISRERMDDWLDIARIGPKEALGILGPVPEGMLDVTPVSTRVNSNRNDGADLIEPVTEEKPKKPAPVKKASGQGELF
jgi:putative SOS response-associated peptidase YedK